MNDDEQTLPCDGKLRFDSKKEAEATGVVIRYRYGSTMHAYLCRYCHLWHLSSHGPNDD